MDVFAITKPFGINSICACESVYSFDRICWQRRVSSTWSNCFCFIFFSCFGSYILVSSILYHGRIVSDCVYYNIDLFFPSFFVLFVLPLILCLCDACSQVNLDFIHRQCKILSVDRLQQARHPLFQVTMLHQDWLKRAL